ncbi:hypothetical protein BCR34DRAFT_380547 [Clohesyomyces aquaticus]|uniref:Uncharacterized protein n=1 Tax=Clohesyomyces aquaticus TaxID=1231657 RepID=A0A1Y2A675_9PLEO|nr:hypothetical protein BCR34DRAFT_380547 [Clohesyomyces aquaticus]
MPSPSPTSSDYRLMLIYSLLLNAAYPDRLLSAADSPRSIEQLVDICIRRRRLAEVLRGGDSNVGGSTALPSPRPPDLHNNALSSYRMTI